MMPQENFQDKLENVSGVPGTFLEIIILLGNDSKNKVWELPISSAKSEVAKWWNICQECFF